MRWKETVISALIALIVAIIAGVVVFFVTRDTKADAEKLIYYVENSAAFSSDLSNIEFVTLVAKNVGTKSAHHVKVVADFGPKSAIQDKKVVFSSGPAATFKDMSSGGQLELEVENFSPTESVTISMLVRNSGAEQSNTWPHLGVESADSIGELVTLSSLHPDENSKFSTAVRVMLTALTVASALLPILALRFIPTLRRIVQKFVPTSPSLNDTAFLYIQMGLIDEAKKLLETAISTHGADAVTLANYALALGLEGDNDGAMTRFDAAEWWGSNPHEKDVVEYDRATLLLSQDQFSEAREHLKEAFSLRGSLETQPQ
jgi:hypothetical protein